MKLDLKKIIFATLEIYKLSFVDAFQGIKSSWKYVFYHLSLFLVFAIALPLISFMPLGYAGGFILGFLLAYLVACYLSTIRAGLRVEKMSMQDMFKEGGELFSPAISFLFAFFVLSFISKTFLINGSSWIVQIINLLLCVFFNPAPEVIISRPNLTFAMLGDCYEFIVENFLEWFVPVFALLLPIIAISPSLFLDITLILMTNNPLNIIQSFVIGVSNFEVLLSGLVFLLPFMFFLYFVSLFRLSLFKRLSSSTRRKRVYQFGA